MQDIVFDVGSRFMKQQLFFPEISAMKAFAIISVIILHVLTYNGSSKFLFDIYAQFHIWQAVPLFMLILGFTFRIEVEKQYSIGKIVSNRIQRLIIPLAIAYIFSFILLKVFGSKISLDWHTFVGLLPIRGMGNYFITLYFETIIFFLIFYAFVKKYNLYFNVIFFLLLTIAMEFISYYININDSYMYASSIHRYIPLVVMGYYFYDEITGNPNAFLYWLGAGSTLLLILYILQGHQHLWIFNSIKWGTQSFPYEYYTYVLAILLFKFFKFFKHNPAFSYWTLIGDSSFHIFIIQIFVFYIFKRFHIVMDIKYGLLALLLSVLLGIIWNKIEFLVLKKSKIQS